MAARPSQARAPEGITIRHTRGCPSNAGGACGCSPGYQAQVYSPRDRRTLRKTFRRLADARAWRAQTKLALRDGTISAPTRLTLNEAAHAWLLAAEAGIVRTRSGETYKPSAIRSYGHALEHKLLPALGHLHLSAVTRVIVQDLVDRLVADGLASSTVRNAILPLRAIYRRAISRGELVQNPTRGLSLPAVRGRRERVARPAEAAALLAALELPERAIYATALYAGLRRGELQGLRWCDVDFKAGLLRVARSWDARAGAIEPKSRSGRRRVPLAAPLRAELAEHRLRQGPGEQEFVFPSRSGGPFSSGWAAERAAAAWGRAALDAIGLQECRHTFAAFMIAAGVNAKALSTFMGHSSITITLDYGHLMPGAEREAAEMLEAYLASTAGAAAGS